MNFTVKGAKHVEVAPGITLPYDVAARFRSWEAVGVSPNGHHRIFTAHDSHLDAVVRIKFISTAPPPSQQQQQQQPKGSSLLCIDAAPLTNNTAHDEAMHKLRGETETAEYLTRSRLMKLLQHPRVVGFHQMIASTTWRMMIGPQLRGGTLRQRLRRLAASDSCWTEADVTTVIRAILQGLLCFHSEGLRYGGVSLDDALLSDEGAPLSALKLRIGRSVTASTELSASICPRTVTSAEGGALYGCVGLLSPEAARLLMPLSEKKNRDGIGHTAIEKDNERIGTASDMWAVGQLAFFLLSGTLCATSAETALCEDAYRATKLIATEGVSLIAAATQRSEVLRWPPAHLQPESLSACSTQERTFRLAQLARGTPFRLALDFIASCCSDRPSDRATAQDALDHPWIASSREVREAQQEHQLPEVVRSRIAAMATDDHGLLSTTPLGRYAACLRAYDAVASSIQPAMKLNSGLCTLWSQGGSWFERSVYVLDLRQCRPGSVGCVAALLAVVRAIASSSTTNSSGSSSPPPVGDGEAPQPPLRLCGIDVSGNGCTDASIAELLSILLQHREHVYQDLRFIRLSQNPKVTHRGARDVIRWLARWQQGGQQGALKEMDWSGCHVSDALTDRKDRLLRFE